MRIQSGEIKFTYGQSLDNLSEVILKQNDIIHLPPKTIHRVEAIVDSYILEISTPELTDVVRHQDDYGRLQTE